jgi:3-oxoacyl-[acyl-carrier-protein] synthase-3
MSDPVYVDGFSYSLGSRSATVQESAAAGRTLTPAGDLLAAGFRTHHMCADDETSYDLALASARAVGDLSDVDAIVYATCIPQNANIGDAAAFTASRDVKHLMDYPASRLQAELGMDRAIVLGLGQQACTSMLGSVRLAGALLGAEPEMRRVLCVSADRFPSSARYEQSYSLISDGGAACIVSREPAAYRLVAAHHITNGAMVAADDDETVGAYFSYTHRLVTEILGKARLTPSDLAWVVPQNTNTSAWAVLSRLLGIDPAKVCAPSMADVAHVISGDNIINMAYLERAGAVRAGDRVLLVMAGYGMNWQALLLEKT